MPSGSNASDGPPFVLASACLPAPLAYASSVFDLGTPWWEILLRTAVIYAALIVGLRLTGKRQIGQMAPFDLVIILLIANAVQNAMVGPDTSLIGGLVSAGALLALNFGVGAARERVRFFEHVVEGEPVVLVSGGKLLVPRMRREHIDQRDLEQAMREHGVDGLEQVKIAVLEVDGTISIVPRSSGTVRTSRPLSRRSPTLDP